MSARGAARRRSRGGRGRAGWLAPAAGGALGAATLALLIALAAPALGPSAGGEASASTPGVAAPIPWAPLSSSLATASGTVVDVAMGELSQPLNTFWQLFTAASSSPRWSLATPTGVADNGGLITAAQGANLVVGFGASNRLRFSPLATSSDGGRAWNPAGAPLPQPIAKVPDALARSASGTVLALEGAGGGTLAESGPSLDSWHSVTSRLAIGATPAGRACRPGRIDAVADAGGSVLLGADCALPGVAGVFAATPGARGVLGGWRLAGPTLPAVLRNGDVGVLRVVPAGTRLDVLLSAWSGSGAKRRPVLLLASRPTAGGGWSLGRALDLPAGARLSSTGLDGDGALLVTWSAGGRTAATVSSPPGSASGWEVLPRPPAGTAALAAGPRGGIEAIAVDRSTMAWSVLDGCGGRCSGVGSWVPQGRKTVDIQYGSSGSVSAASGASG